MFKRFSYWRTRTWRIRLILEAVLANTGCCLIDKRRIWELGMRRRYWTSTKTISSRVSPGTESCWDSTVNRVVWTSGLKIITLGKQTKKQSRKQTNVSRRLFWYYFAIISANFELRENMCGQTFRPLTNRSVQYIQNILHRSSLLKRQRFTLGIRNTGISEGAG